MTDKPTPQHWPPRAGDVWTDHEGDPWFAVHLTHHELDDGEATVLVSREMEGVEPGSEEADDVRNWWGPLTLAYRHDEPTDAERLAAVRALHHDPRSPRWCPVCATSDDNGEPASVPHPCPTYRAVTGEQDGDDRG